MHLNNIVFYRECCLIETRGPWQACCISWQQTSGFLRCEIRYLLINLYAYLVNHIFDEFKILFYRLRL